MHRVELKAQIFKLWDLYHFNVPNAPCGVERKLFCPFLSLKFLVPNAPCGVERRTPVKTVILFSRVPNAPCGVERMAKKSLCLYQSLFLMHRVELKGG